MEQENIPTKIKRELLANEIRMWQQGLYLHEVRAKVAMKIGDKQRQQSATKEAETAQMMIDELIKELESLPKEEAAKE
jgi:hypothetical protein